MTTTHKNYTGARVERDGQRQGDGPRGVPGNPLGGDIRVRFFPHRGPRVQLNRRGLRESSGECVCVCM